MQREDLTVEVREADRIVVDQLEGADAASAQGLKGIAAHPAEAEYGHAGAGEPFHALRAEEHPCSGKLIAHALSSVLFVSYDSGACGDLST